MNYYHKRHMQTAIDFAQARNPVWPFAALVVDENDSVLVKATDAVHISPIFHAEVHAIHRFATEYQHLNPRELTLYSTVECDTMSQCAVYWAHVLGIPIKKVVFGARYEAIRKMWDFGVNITASEVIEKSSDASVELIGPVPEDEYNALFLQAKERKKEIGGPHPGKKALSPNLNDFYELVC